MLIKTNTGNRLRMGSRTLTRKENKMEQKNDTPVRELVPLMFQLRELVLPESECSKYLNMTQSSCGGEDTFQ
jgi:hypothetical protein